MQPAGGPLAAQQIEIVQRTGAPPRWTPTTSVEEETRWLRERGTQIADHLVDDPWNASGRAPNTGQDRRDAPRPRGIRLLRAPRRSVDDAGRYDFQPVEQRVDPLARLSVDHRARLGVVGVGEIAVGRRAAVEADGDDQV